MRRVPLLFIALAALAAAPASAPPDTKTRVDAVFQEYDRSDSPGCALGVYRDGGIAYARGYGMANLELGVANSAQTIFDIGSTSKQFTAFSIQLLAREGKLSLDDDVRKWVPEIPSYGKLVTIRHLLHHTSGLRDYIVAMELQGVQEEDYTTEQDALDILTKQKAANFVPGQEYLYSNTGYFLLGVIVKRASGQPLREFAAERIFAPLGMRHTQFNDSHTRIIPNRATGYQKADPSGFGIEMSDWEQIGDGSVLTSVEDLQRWDQNFYEPKVGDSRLVETMHETGVLNSRKKIGYASALMIGTYRGLPTVSHSGSWAGYRAQLLRFPKQHFSVACLCNLGNANPTRLAYKVAEVYLGDAMQKEKPPAAAGPAGRAPITVPLKNLQALTGTYRDPVSTDVIRLGVREGKLVADADARSFPLSATAANRFRFEGYEGGKRELELERVRGARPRLRVVTMDDEEEPSRQTFEPVDAWVPGPEALAQLAGVYASEEVGTTWRLVAQEGKLFVRHRGISPKPLTPTIRDTFKLEGLQLTFERGAGEGATGFLLDAGRVKNLTFRREVSP